MPASEYCLPDDGFVSLDTSDDIIRLHRQDFLQCIGRAVSFERPDFHFSETLSAELCLAAQRLLRNKEYGPVERAWILSSTR